MAGGIDWFRWHHGSVTDPKFQLVAKKACARLGDVITVWAFVLEKASADTERGTIGVLDFETLDFLLGTEEGTAARILDAMTARGLIVGSRIARWEERQPKREREDDGSAERKRRQREREAAERQEQTGDAIDSNVTPRHATSRQETPRGEERRGEKNSPSNEGEKKRGSRLPDPFILPDEYRDFCLQERADLSPDAVAAKFADYWHGKPGKAGTKLDWLATWRNWIREERAPQTSRGSGGTAYQQSQRERVAEFAPALAKRTGAAAAQTIEEVPHVPAIASR